MRKRSFAPFCVLLRSFADLRLRSFVFFCILKREHWASGFFRGFCRRTFSPHFLWEKVPRKILQEIPGKILQKFYNRNPRHTFLQRGRANKWEGFFQDSGSRALQQRANLLLVALHRQFWMYKGYLPKSGITTLKGSRTGIPREQAHRKPLERWTLMSLALYNAPSLHIVDKDSHKITSFKRNSSQKTLLSRGF